MSLISPDMSPAQQAALRDLTEACRPENHEARQRWHEHEEAAFAERLCPLCAVPLGQCPHRWRRDPDGCLSASMGMQILGPP